MAEQALLTVADRSDDGICDLKAELSQLRKPSRDWVADSLREGLLSPEIAGVQRIIGKRDELQRRVPAGLQGKSIYLACVAVSGHKNAAAAGKPRRVPLASIDSTGFNRLRMDLRLHVHYESGGFRP